MSLLKHHLRRPWLVAELGGPCRVLSFAPYRPGFTLARHIVWREVRNADLSAEFDATRWFASEMAANNFENAVGMLTSRDIGRAFRCEARIENISAAAIATVGLGNAERVGVRFSRPGPDGKPSYGTINIAVQLRGESPDWGLTEVAQTEALTIVAQARTAAVMDAGPNLPVGRVTGTGTDCIALAAPPGSQCFAGLHTAVGEAIGKVVYHCVTQGVQDWMQENGGLCL